MTGKQIIQNQLSNIPTLPGVYQMLDSSQTILYIGKAKNLKKRVASYTKDLPLRIARMISIVHELKYTITNSEAEALLLEATLIKKHKPKFNVLLKDDKSFPYIKISNSNGYPQIAKFRGKILKGANYFGPFASAKQVDLAITEIQKIFKLRTCSDNYFSTRKRACLMYQIQKCSAPCVGKVNQLEYQSLAGQATSFLSGKSKELLETLKKEMKQHSLNCEYEKAAGLRDRIKAIEHIMEKNSMSLTNVGNADVIAVKSSKSIVCVQIFIYRGGQNFGSNSYYPANAENVEIKEILMSFIGQFYQNKKCPERIIVSQDLGEEADLLQDALYKLHEIKTKIVLPKNKEQKMLMAMAEQTVQLNLNDKINRLLDIETKLQGIQEIFDLPNIPSRIELYDNSHIMGQYAVGAMVVVGKNGLEKNEYRKFNIRTNINMFGGDDYQMLREVLTRRFAKLTKANKPDLIIVDGGKGHLSVVDEVMSCLNLDIKYVCMAKGPNRNKGEETFHMPNKEPFSLPNNNKIMQYLQVLRDEVHNFAIKSHRHKRNITTLKTKI
jgi:excinuclease ABC subunit C